MKRIVAFLLMVLVVMTFTACSSTSEKEANVASKPASTSADTSAASADKVELPEITMTIGTAAPEASSAFTVLSKFKDTVESESDGKITVDLYPNGQLGNDSELVTSCLQGNLSMVFQSGSTHATLVPQAAFFDTPFLIKNFDFDTIEKALTDSEFRNMYNQYYEDAGFKLLTVKVWETMNLSSNVPVYNMDDLKGLKIRVAQSESRMAFWKSVGANPTPLPFGELYMGLQQGLVTASDNVYANIVGAKLVEQQKYIIPTNHMSPSFELMMNKDFYDGLPEEYKAIVDNAAAVTQHFDFQVSKEEQDKYYNQIVDEYKLEVCEVSDEFRADMVEHAKGAIDSVKAIVNDEKLYDAFKDAMNE